MSVLSSAIRNTGHCHVRPSPICVLETPGVASWVLASYTRCWNGFDVATAGRGAIRRVRARTEVTMSHLHQGIMDKVKVRALSDYAPFRGSVAPFPGSVLLLEPRL